MKSFSSNSLGFLLSDTARLLRKRFDQRARDLGLTRAQWQVLAHLTHYQGINQARIAEILEIEPITLSRHVDKMEEAGWVRREPDPGDRRARLLYLTDSAESVIEEMRKIGRELLAEVLDGLPETHRTCLLESLQHLRCKLSDRPAQQPAETAAPVLKRA